MLNSESQEANGYSDLIGCPALARKLTMTRFPHVSGFEKEELALPLYDFKAIIMRMKKRNKESTPLISLGQYGDDTGISPSGKSYRTGANLLFISGVEVDYDGGPLSPEKIQRRLEENGVAALIYTTSSHALPGKGNRVRVLAPCSEDLAPSARAALVARLYGVLGDGMDEASFNVAQAFHFGGVVGGQPVQVLFAEGDYIDRADHLPERWKTTSGGGAVSAFDPVRALDLIRSGENYHGPMVALVGHWSATGVGWAESDRRLRAAFHEVTEADRDARWRDRVRSISTILAHVYGRDVRRTVAESARLAAALDTLGDGVVIDDDDSPEAGRSAEREFADGLAEWSDTWAGARHADRFLGRRVYVSATSQWLGWSGQRWAAQTAEETMADGLETTAALVAEAARAVRGNPNDQTRRRLSDAARLHGNAARLARMIESARAEWGMHVASPAEFDANPTEITVHNGILDLRTGTLRPARAEDRVSKLAGCAFDPAACAPMWERFLAVVLPDPAVRSFVQRAAGYTLTGLVDEEVFFLAHGTGQNGKSIFANALAALLGEYNVTLGPEIVTKQRNENEAKRQEARLPGKRLALANETQEGDVWDSARMKRISSREKMDARHLYSEGFDFMPTAKLWVRTNHLPGVLDAGDAFWRRCMVVPFAVKIPDGEKIPDLDRKIISSELPGVLNWALAGAMEWFRAGLQVPKSIRAVVQDYRADTDLLAQWIAERTERDPRAELTVAAAFKDWAAFCEGLGVKPGSAPLLSRNMGAKGHKSQGRKKGPAFFRGIRLREERRRFGDDVEEYGYLI